MLREITPPLHSLDVIAKHLAKIEIQMKELQESNIEILTRLKTTLIILLEEIAIPCDNEAELKNLETWIAVGDNKAVLVRLKLPV